MPCEAIDGLKLAGGELGCAEFLSTPATAMALCAMVAAALAASLRRGPLPRRAASAAMFAASAAFLAVSAVRPVWIAEAETSRAEEGLVVALIDSSESFWRDEVAARDARDLLAQRADEIRDAAKPLRNWNGAALVFDSGTRAQGSAQPLERLPAAIRSVEPARPGERSMGDVALEEALELIAEAGGRGTVLLATDGRFETKIPDALLDRAAASGVSISVLGAGAGNPAEGLVAANIGPEQTVGANAVLRAAVLGGGTITASTAASREVLEVPDRSAMRPVRVETRFARRGLRHVSLTFDDGETRQRRTLHTMVRGPARALVFGDAPWLEGLDPTRWDFERAEPSSPPDPGQFDLVVVDAVSPDAFPRGYDGALYDAAGETGLFIVNGGLRGSEEDRQLIGDWNESAASPILPVDSDPRKFVVDPPGRDIVIMIDVSGSMAISLGRAKAVAMAVLDQLRPRDTVAILPFSDISHPGFARRHATPDALSRAHDFVSELTAGGGTAPAGTLREAARMRTNYCGFFFISDAGFEPVRTSPQCFTTSVSVEGQAFPQGVSDWGQEIILDPGLPVPRLVLDYFEPEERDMHYRSETFAPIAAGETAPLAGQTLPGVAIAYPRTDAEVVSLHPDPPPDPVLAVRQDPVRNGALAAVYLSELPANAPAAEVDAALSGLLAWNEPDRFDIRVRQDGDRLTVSVLALADGAAERPIPATLSGAFHFPGEGARPLAFRPAGAPGRFEATLTVRPRERAMTGRIVLTEPGGRVQSIPVSLPESDDRSANAGGSEALDFGVDGMALRRIAARTGGIDLADAAPRIGFMPPTPERLPLHPLTIAAALLLLAGALWIGERRG